MSQPVKVIVRHSPLTVGFPGLLTLLFVALKLTSFVTWSWAWVTAPLWLPLAVLIGGGVLFALFCVVMALIFN
jgi:hypothetical protein